MRPDEGAPSMKEPKLALGPDLVKLVAEIDEFKGRWEALKTLSPDDRVPGSGVGARCCA